MKNLKQAGEVSKQGLGLLGPKKNQFKNPGLGVS